jgi:hypothetical protein
MLTGTHIASPGCCPNNRANSTFVVEREKESMGPYIFKDAALLRKWASAPSATPLADAVTPSMDTGVQCVGLVKYYTSAGAAFNWAQGDRVLEQKSLTTGTAIATFDPKTHKYNSHDHGNHACFFLSFVSGGIKVLEQHVRPNLTSIQTREIKARGIGNNKVSPSDNADAYSVIL